MSTLNLSQSFCEIHPFDVLAYIFSDVFSHRSLGVLRSYNIIPLLYDDQVDTDQILTCVSSVSYNSSHYSEALLTHCNSSSGLYIPIKQFLIQQSWMLCVAIIFTRYKTLGRIIFVWRFCQKKNQLLIWSFANWNTKTYEVQFNWFDEKNILEHLN